MEFIIVSVLLIATASFVGGWALVSFYKAELHYVMEHFFIQIPNHNPI